MPTNLHTVLVLSKLIQDILREYSEGEKIWHQLYHFDYSEWRDSLETVYQRHGWLQSGMVYLPASSLRARLLEKHSGLLGFFHPSHHASYGTLLNTSPVEPLRSDADFAFIAARAPSHLHVAPERFGMRPLFVSVKSAPDNPLEEESFHIEKEEYLRLREKTSETISAAALACERMAKDQEQIEQLKMETRARLTQMHAA